VLLAREGRAVVARDVSTLDSLGAVPDGAGDLWFVGRWKPASAAVAARQQARRLDTATARAAPAPRPAPVAVAAAPARAPVATPPAATPAPRPAAERAQPAPAREPPAPVVPAPAPDRNAAVWVQVSASQNERLARDLAAELAHAGYPARVASPTAPPENWRVLVGPYPTRSAADSAARLLGRPYWITARGPADAGRP